MNEDWQGVTQEKAEARRNFFADLFPIWKGAFCREMAQRNSRFLTLEDKIVWRLEDNVEYNPAKLTNLYFGTYRKKLLLLMEDRAGRLDRHKIVALTQHMILDCYPVTYSFTRPFDLAKNEMPCEAVRSLNISFAYKFALEFLRAWNQTNFRTKSNSPLDSDRLFECLESTHFAREHYKLLMLDSDFPFPTLVISQLWFSLEQWGLEYMRNRNPV